MSDPWQFIPRAILDEDKRQQTASAWAATQRAGLAQQWADQQRSWLGDLLGQPPDLHALAVQGVEQAGQAVGGFADQLVQAAGGGLGMVGQTLDQAVQQEAATAPPLEQMGDASRLLEPARRLAGAGSGLFATEMQAARQGRFTTGEERLGTVTRALSGEQQPSIAETTASALPPETPGIVRGAATAAGTVLDFANPGGLAMPFKAPGGTVQPTGNVAVDTLTKMYSEAPKKPGLSGVPRAEQLRRDFERAWTDRGVDASILQQNVAKNTGGTLAMDEMMAELQRLDPNKAAETAIQESVKPAIRRVGADQPYLSAYMTLRHNLDVADAMGEQAAKDVLSRPMKPTLAQRNLTGAQGALRLDQAALTRAGGADAAIQARITQRQADIQQLQQRVTRDQARYQRTQQAAAGKAQADVTANRRFSGSLDRAASSQALLDLRTALGPDRMANVEQSAQDLWAFNQNLLKRRLDSGLVDQELYDTLVQRYPHYSPTVILDYLETEAQRIGAGKSISVSANGLKRMTEEGTTRAREDPLTSTIRNAYQTEALARKNDAFNAFVKLVDRDPGLQSQIEKVGVGAKHTVDWKPVQGFVNGEKVEYLVPDYLAGAVAQEPGAVIPAIGPALAVWRAMVTSRNPAFLTSNALSDAGTYMLREMTRGGGPQAAPRALAELLKAYAQSFSGIFRGEYRGDLAAYFKGGGGMGGFTNVIPRSGAEALRTMQRGNVFELKSKGDALRLLRDVLTLKPVEAVSERIEAAPRVAAYNLAKRRGANEVQAIIAGRTVTVDFAQGGNWAKVVNQVVPFFNVGIQGGATLVRAARENPRGMALTALTTLVAPTLAAEAWNRSDPQRAQDYADVPQYLKDQGIVIMIPGYAPQDAQGNRRPQFLHVRTREFSPFVIGTREIASRVLGDDPRAWNELAGGVLQSVSPIQSADIGGVASQLVPPGISTAVELRADKDFYRNRQITSERADENASPISQAAAGALGGRPSQWEYAARDLGSGPAQMVSEGAKALAGKPSSGAGPSGIPVAGPVLKRFVRGDIGETLNRAQENVLSPGARQAFKEGGVAYEPGAVRRELQGVPLTVQEQARLQEATNRYVEEAIVWLRKQPGWDRATPEQREDKLKELIGKAREKAATELKTQVGRDEAKRRVLAGVR